MRSSILLLFEVLELNPTVCRTGKYVFDTVAEAVVSHQVQKSMKNKRKHQQLQDAAKGSKQLNKFFSCNKDDASTEENLTVDAMSLVLLEQVFFGNI